MREGTPEASGSRKDRVHYVVEIGRDSTETIVSGFDLGLPAAMTLADRIANPAALVVDSRTNRATHCFRGLDGLVEGWTESDATDRAWRRAEARRNGSMVVEHHPSARRTVCSGNQGAWILQCPEGAYAEWLYILGVDSGGWLIRKRGRPSSHGKVGLPNTTPSKYFQKMRVGDLVYIWVSGKSGRHIRALTSITQKDLKPEERGDVIRPGTSAPPGPADRWIGLAPLEILDEPIMRPDLKSEPRLADLLVLRQPQGSTYPVTKKERRVLDLLVDKQIRRAEAGRKGADAMKNGRQLSEDIGGLISSKLRIDPPEIREAPELVHGVFREAYVLDFSSLSSADFFVRVSDEACEAGLLLDDASSVKSRKSHEIDYYAEKIWEHLELLEPEFHHSDLVWGQGAPVGGDHGYKMSGPSTLQTWYRTPADHPIDQWVYVRLERRPDTALFDVSNRLARALIALDCLSFRGGDRPVFTPLEPVRVFVSYAHEEDNGWTSRLIEELQSAAGQSVEFLYDQKINHYQGWDEQLEEWMHGCDAVLFVVSPKSLRPERFTWKNEVLPLLERRKEEPFPIVGVLKEEISAEEFDKLGKGVGIQISSAEAPGKQPLFPLGVHRWNATVVRDLIRRPRAA